MIAIVDYRAGNLTSVRLACESLGLQAQITSDPEQILSAERVIFPGVGAAGAAMGHLNELKLADTLRAVVAQGTPFLGICLGTQIILEHSEEDGGVDTVGLLKGNVRLFRPTDPLVKVPQIGWNTVKLKRSHPVFAGIEDESEFYFVHSYHPEPDLPECILGETEYAGVTFASAMGRDNLVATQFHPEKSGRIGLRLLNNFATWNGRDGTEVGGRKSEVG
ncbi:MAG: imidazole glycerol phosphate synthase subunit HisH [Verrucomicrobia bacterium]|jgi:imidazole glycerol-phosphate synthase subunit HisH|nr:imidazole glycerol phosphate synthase subunit HisH [Verrucomicrobiota bacterium]MBT7066587.1 imidazole glycerol phosphate synthase subunit HisH [Verrucomicrobiota bacterium]MBT7701517.1 imidazole glycerol phosphate synthase subunit HisH [Verrucomicrobiota bacterium]